MSLDLSSRSAHNERFVRFSVASPTLDFEGSGGCRLRGPVSRIRYAYESRDSSATFRRFFARSSAPFAFRTNVSDQISCGSSSSSTEVCGRCGLGERWSFEQIRKAINFGCSGLSLSSAEVMNWGSVESPLSPRANFALVSVWGGK